MQPGERQSPAASLVEGTLGESSLGDLGQWVSAPALDFARQGFGPAAAFRGVLGGQLAAGGILFEANGLGQPGVHQSLRFHA